MTQRTAQQNKSLHLYCELLAEALNDAGLDMKKVFEVKEVDIPWNKDIVKSVLWRPIQEAMTGEESTTKLNTTEVSEIYETLNRHIASHFGISIDWPSAR